MKKAFTMLELIMVIVIIGILAAVIIPRIGSNKTAEAAVELISDIRYTQHLAMVDDKYGENTETAWYTKLWQIKLSTNSYTIESNGVAAKDPINKENLVKNLNTKYGVTITNFTNCGSDAIKTISFDHIGRPLTDALATSPYNNLMVGNDCVMTLSDGSTDINITIRRETGYASLL